MKVFVLINSSSSLPIVDIFFTGLEAEQIIPEDIGMQDLAAGVESQTGLRIRSDIARIRILPLWTYRIRIHAFF